MKTPTITEIKAAAKNNDCEVKRAGYLSGNPSYKVVTVAGERLMTKENVIEQFMRGDLF